MTRRFSLVVVAMVLNCGLAALFAADAVRTARDHRRSAEGVLRDYATLAVDQFTERLSVRVATQLYPVLALMATRGGALGTGPLERRDRLAPLDGEMPRATLAMAHHLFRIERATGVVTVDDAGEPMDEAGLRALRDSVITHAGRSFDKDAYFGITRLSDSAHTLAVYAAGRDRDSAGTIRVLYGFTLPDSMLLLPIRAALRGTPLLPPSLVHGVSSDSVAGIAVTAGSGVPIVERRFDRTSPYTATRALGKASALVQIHVSLAARLAPSLIIGGLPRSQLPALLALLALASALGVTAVLQLRRERAFAALREDFVSGVSHEIRTPLAQIRLFSETLRLGRVRSDAERERSHEIIDQESQRLAHLVDNLLHFSRAERGAVRITKERTDLGRLVSDVAEHFRPMASSRHVSVETCLAPELEVNIDPNAFRQILLNLFDNALKYGPDGQVITVSTTREGAGILLAVSDQGPGVPAEATERIWDRFWRDERARNSAVVGTGIGLAIVRELVTLHGGRATVTKSAGGGARFEIRLPA